MPWDVVAVQATEPLAGLASHLEIVDPANPGSPSISFADATLAEGVPATDTWAWAWFTDWDAVRGTTQTVSVLPSLKDGTGKPVQETSFSLTVLDVGEAAASHDFEGTALGVAGFGNVTVDAGAVTIVAPCNSGTGGIAGRLITSGAQKVFAKVQPDQGSSVQFRLWGRSGATYESDSWVEPDPDGWATLEVPIGAEDEVGFTVSPNSLCHWTTNASVVVDRIWAE